MRRAVTVLVLLLTLAPAARAQNFAPPPPAPPPRPAGVQANICSTEWGWCPVQTVVTPGGVCYCFVPPATWLAGSARYWPYRGPVSPYLNPHTTPPSTLR